jgi:molybdopterin-guanine dinucleotide biosynthesis protein A
LVRTTYEFDASAIILIGGRSSRMGRDKASLPFGNSSILGRQLAQLRSVSDDLIVVAAPQVHSDPALERILDNAEVTVLRDASAYQGAAGALVHGLRAARHDRAFVCSGDLPLLQAEIVRAIYRRIREYDAAIPIIGTKLQPLCAAYRRRCADVLANGLMMGERRLTALCRDLHAYFVGEQELRSVDPSLSAFLNVNTTADYQRALAELAKMCAP